MVRVNFRNFHSVNVQYFTESQSLQLQIVKSRSQTISVILAILREITQKFSKFLLQITQE